MQQIDSIHEVILLIRMKIFLLLKPTTFIKVNIIMEKKMQG